MARWNPSPRARRGLVIGFLLLLAMIPAVGWATGELWPVLALLVPWGLGLVALSLASGGIFDKPVRKLSEEQRRVRYGFINDPYFVGAAVGLVGGMVSFAAFLTDAGTLMGLQLLVYGLVFGLPSMVVAWRGPRRG